MPRGRARPPKTVCLGLMAALGLLGRACAPGPKPPPQVQIGDLRELMGSAPDYTFVWDAGSEPIFTTPVGYRTPTALWISSGSPPQTLRTDSETVAPREYGPPFMQIRVQLPAEPGRGQLVLRFVDHAVTYDVELWPPRALIRTKYLPPEPAATYEARLKTAREHPDPAVAAAAWVDHFRHHLREGCRDPTQRSFDAMAEAADDRGLHYSAIRARATATFCHMKRGQWLLAASRLGEAEAKWVEAVGLRLRSNLAHFRSELLVTGQEPTGAEETLELAISLAERAGVLDSLSGPMEFKMILLARLGRFAEARALAKTLPPVSENAYYAGSRYGALADLHFRMWLDGRVDAVRDEGLRLFGRAQAIFSAAALHGRAASHRADHAWWLILDEQPEAAFAVLGDLEDGEELEWAKGLPTLTRALGELQWGQPEAARRRLEALIERGHIGGGRAGDHLAGIYDVVAVELLARAYADLGHSVKAAELLARALAAAQRIAAQVSPSATPRAAFEQRQALRKRAIESLVAVGRHETAFMIDDRHRALVLSRLDDSAGRPVPSDVQAVKERLLSSLPARCLPPTFDKDCTARYQRYYDEVRRLIQQGESPLRRALLRLTEDEATAEALPDPEIEIDELRAQLGPHQMVWVATATGTSLEAPPFGFALSGALDAPIYYGRLDVQTLDGFDHLYFVTDEIPKAQVLVRDLAQRQDSPSLSILPYASWLTSKASPPLVAGNTVLVADSARDLRFARQEGQRLQGAWPGVRAWIGGAALSPEAFLAAANGAEVVHLALHAQVLGKDPWTTQLRLDPSTTLNLVDWIAAAPSVGLVVLNGCATAGTSAYPGEVGFPQAQLQTGTDTVLATVRNVFDMQAERFIKDFYEEDGRHRPARAYRVAVQRSLRRRDRAWQSFLLWGLPKTRIHAGQAADAGAAPNPNQGLANRPPPTNDVVSAFAHAVTQNPASPQKGTGRVSKNRGYVAGLGCRPQ